MATVDELYAKLEEEGKQKGVKVDDSYRKDLENVYQGDASGKGARTSDQIYNSLSSQINDRATNTPNSDGSGGGMSSWLGNSGGGDSGGGGDIWNYIRQQQEAAAAQQAATNAKRDALYGQLQARANTATNFTADDPIIKGQVDQYRAEQERSRRNSVSDSSERGRPLSSIERAMAQERVGQATGGMQAQLMANELSNRRAEITGALQQMGGLLDADQQAALQQELHSLDSMIGNQNSKNDLLRTMLGNSQYYAGLGSQNDQFNARLGFDTADRAAFWDDQRRNPRG